MNRYAKLQSCRQYYDYMIRIDCNTPSARHLLAAIQIAEAKVAGEKLIRSALEGALVLADCLADTKDDPEAFKGNNDNYMRIKDALARVTKPEGE